MVRSYLHRWLRAAFKRTFGLGDKISGIAGAVLPIIGHFVAGWEGPVNDFLWQVPVYGLALAMGVRLLVAPYELWKEEKERADNALAAISGPDTLAKEIERARKIAAAEEEERARIRRRETFHGRLGNRSVSMADTPPAKPRWTNMPLHEVFRHVAFDSKWAATYDRFSDADPECQRDGEYALAKEVREALARGEVSARGRHYVQGTDWGFTLASEPIPKEFWPNTYMQPFGEIALRDDARCIVTLMRRTNSDPTDKYREIKLSREEVLSHWPRQRQAIGPLAPTQFAKDYVKDLQRHSRMLDDEPES